MMQSDSGGPMPPGGGSGSGELPNFPSWSPPTNGALWLEITNVVNGVALANLHNATDYVYEVWSKPDLTAPAWSIETEVFPGPDTNVAPFTVPQSARTNLFLWARDWTGITSGGNTVPEWWFWKYFGTVDLSDTDLDTQGNTLLYDYQNTNDPNIISFTVRLGNQNFNTTNATGSYVILSGVPSYEAVLVDDTNFADASWQPYDGIVHLSLGPTDGVYQVWMGLKGRAADSQATWFGTDVTLNRSVPQITVTSPTNAVVAQPWLQLQGYSAAPLEQVTYDLNGITNLQGSITASTVDTNTFSYTTDYFQCYDLRLTNGPNSITLHATDPAGNTFTTNFTVTLDYSNASQPVIQLTWPQDGMEICGSSITLRGWTEDAAATVTAQITDSNGNTNVINGMVERTGVLWGDNLPLAEGTNVVTLWVTNAAGLSSATNFSVVKSDMTLTLDSYDSDLWLPTVRSVSGHISDPDAPIWVNGVQGTNNGDGTWSAQNVPVTPGGVASFDMSTTPPGGSDPAANAAVTKPDEMKLESAIWRQHYFITELFNTFPGVETPGSDTHDETGTFSTWNGGHVHTHDVTSGFYLNTPGFCPNCDATDDYTLGPDQYVTLHHHHEANFGGSDSTDTNRFLWNIYEHSGSISVQEEDYAEFDQSSIHIMFHIGGKGKAGDQVVVEGAAQILADGDTVPANEIAMSQLGPMTADGVAYAVVADAGGATVSMTPQTDRPYYLWPNYGGAASRLVSQCNATIPSDRTRTMIGVGEEVGLYFPNLYIDYTNFVWSTTAGSLLYTNGSSTQLTAPGNATNVTVTATVLGKPITKAFNVLEPYGYDHAQIIATNHYPAGTPAAGMTNAIWFAPTNVSFYRVNVMEVGEDGTNISGYFSQWTPQQLHHPTADYWTPLDPANRFNDAAYSGSEPSPWSAGAFSWNIPARWQVIGSGATNSMHGWDQNFSIDSSGTVTVQKFKHSVTRTINDVITTQ